MLIPYTKTRREPGDLSWAIYLVLGSLQLYDHSRLSAPDYPFDANSSNSYNGGFPKLDLDGKKPYCHLPDGPPSRPTAELVKLWVFADNICLPGLQDKSIITLLIFYNNIYKTPSLALIPLVYNIDAAGSKLRWFVATAACLVLTPGGPSTTPIKM